MNIGISMPFRIQLEDSLIIQPSDDSDVVIKANSLGKLQNIIKKFIIFT